jgi:hypothetical protein
VREIPYAPLGAIVRAVSGGSIVWVVIELADHIEIVWH